MYGLNASDPPQELTREKPHLWVLAANGAGGFLLATFATLAFMAPLRLVKSISLAKNVVASGRYGNTKFVNVALRFEMRRSPLRLPFVQRKGAWVIDAELRTVYMDRRVRSLESMAFYPVPVDMAQSWTAEYFTPAPRRPRSVLSRLRGFNDSLLNTWPALKQNVRRLMLREGMADVRIPGHGRVKVDLQGCEILEHGRVLERVVSGVLPLEMETWWDRRKQAAGL